MKTELRALAEVAAMLFLSVLYVAALLVEVTAKAVIIPTAIAIDEIAS